MGYLGVVNRKTMDLVCLFLRVRRRKLSHAKPRSGAKKIAGGEAKRNPRMRQTMQQAPKGRQNSRMILPPYQGLDNFCLTGGGASLAPGCILVPLRGFMVVFRQNGKVFLLFGPGGTSGVISMVFRLTTPWNHWNERGEQATPYRKQGYYRERSAQENDDSQKRGKKVSSK